MNGPFQASYYKLVNVYIRVPGPFVAAGDNDDIIAQGFFDERRRTNTWPYTVPTTSVPQKYHPQPQAWLKASHLRTNVKSANKVYPSGSAATTKKPSVAQAQSQKAPVVQQKAPVVQQKAPVVQQKTTAVQQANPAATAVVYKPAPRVASAPATTTSSSPSILDTFYWPKDALFPVDFFDIKPMKQKRLTGCAVPNKIYPKQKQLSAWEKQDRHNKVMKARASRGKNVIKVYMPVSKCPGPFAAAGDNTSSLPLGFFCEWRMTNHWDGFFAEKVTPIKYVPQPKAWLRAAKEIIRPAHLRAPKETKKRKQRKVKKIYMPVKKLFPSYNDAAHTIFNASPRQIALSKFHTEVTRHLSKEIARSQEMKQAARTMSFSKNQGRRAVQQPTRRH